MNQSHQVKAVLIYQNSKHSSENEYLLSEALRRIRLLHPDRPVYTNHQCGDLKTVDGNVAECLRHVLESTADEDQDSVALYYDFCPLLDAGLAEEVQQNHFRYLAHYTYSENIPPGLVPDYASLEFVRALGSNAPADLRGFIFKNINEYDVEVFYKLPDLRQHRLDMSCATSRSRKFAEMLLGNDNDICFKNLESLVQNHPELLRPYPSFIEVELTTDSPVSPIFIPERKIKTESRLDLSLVEKLISDINTNGLIDDVTISLGGVGEPLLHPEFTDILKQLLGLSQVTRVYLETYGVHFSRELIKIITNFSGIEKLHVIIRLTTLKKERYKTLYGADLFDDVNVNIGLIESEAELPFTVFAEMIKMKDVEDEITQYFDRFEKSSIQVILQKFNTYAGVLQQRRVSDLTPLHRDFCWHLARDIYITAGGMVPLCKQDPFAEHFSHDFRKHSILEILNDTMKHHIASVRSEHEEIPMPCLKCDEWYTFNG